MNTAVAFDYLVRYSVTDSSQLDAIEVIRIVRVQNVNPKKLSQRYIGTTASHLGFIEHLPASYTENPGQKFPLLIFNHGSGANASRVAADGSTPRETLNAVLSSAGPALAISFNNWYESDPFIVLSPQMVDLTFEDPVERLNAFVDFAALTYNVDVSRIYVSGWSSGASLSLNYAVLHPDRVAAVVPIAAGLRVTNTSVLPDGFCDVEDVPMWAFHGDEDQTISPMVSIDNHNSIINSCLPPVTPKLTVYQGIGHFIHHDTYELRLMENGSSGISGDPTFDLYDQNIFEWLLSHTLQNRNIP